MIAITRSAKMIDFMQYEKTLATLSYQGIFSWKAHVILPDNSSDILISRVSLWKNICTVTVDRQEIYSSRFLFFGKVRIESKNDIPEIFLLKHKGFFFSKAVLVDKDGRELATMQRRFRWKGLKFDYHFELSDAFKRREGFILLLTLMVYLERIRKKRRSGAMSS
jgi:hypothetical protein